MSYRQDVEAALEAFSVVAQLGNSTLLRHELVVEYLDAPHRPPSRLPSGKVAVYGFWANGCWLKIGKVGSNSHARYTSQHYNPGSAPSTLAASLRGDEAMTTIAGFDAAFPGAWIKEYTCRANILMAADKPREMLSLLEAFLHLRLRPRYER
ncbi:hypothetical protein RFN28_00815 [Mesorhizobium sp. VK24D]|uniref:GIY-YIG nuclease family protein n=1 Tax=Mesorhizobium album TaxID=3072314 RepID=A0ABU4XQK6_9HYPH|nr:hypothetical protein [Mesorhizobium sp. VK24D]MDX8477012.1 hypothetical protein [Mesorhizobium sp. VK24D]